MRLLDLDRTVIESILQRSVEYASESTVAAAGLRNVGPVASLFQGSSYWEEQMTEMASTRLGKPVARLRWPDQVVLSDEERLEFLSEIGASLQLLLTTSVDPDTFGAGRAFLEKAIERTGAGFVDLRDDIYAHLASLAHLSVLHQALGALRGKRVVLGWGFGSRFELPSTVHSLLTTAPILGLNVRLVCPLEFAPLRRVVKQAHTLAARNSTELVELRNLDEGLSGADAVILLNWCCLDHFNDYERNREIALSYKDWFLSAERLPPDCYFVTQPPAETDLIATDGCLRSTMNLTPKWFGTGVAVLCALMEELAKGEVSVPRMFL